MHGYWQAVALLLLSVILLLTVRKHNGEVAVVLSIAACCLVLLLLAGYLKPVLDFLRRLQTLADVDGQMVSILGKVVGICLVGEIAGCICADSGNAALGKTLQLLSAVVILYLSVPMLETLMDLVESLLGRL